MDFFDENNLKQGSKQKEWLDALLKFKPSKLA